MAHKVDSARLFVAGHNGMVGAAVVRQIAANGLPPPIVASRHELDLCDQSAVRAFMAEKKPTAVLMAAARVGGIEANRSLPTEFIYENMIMAANVIEAAFRAGVPRLLFLGSSCIYPRLAPQPMAEDTLMSGPLEPTNEWYAIAKIAGLKLCQAYRQQYNVCYHSAMPTNLYGPGDNYNLTGSHVLPALIRRFEEARQHGTKEVTLWGSGTARREFLHVDDLADALLFLLSLENPPDWINVGSGQEVTIRELAGLIRDATNAKVDILWDRSKPDGSPRKLLDSTLLQQLGWQPQIALKHGIARTVTNFRKECATGTARL